MAVVDVGVKDSAGVRLLSTSCALCNVKIILFGFVCGMSARLGPLLLERLPPTSNPREVRKDLYFFSTDRKTGSLNSKH